MKWIISLVVALLLGSNAWLGYRLMRAGEAHAELERYARGENDSLRMCVAIGNQVLRSETRKDVLVDAARAAGGDYPAFSNDGHLWLGSVGMRFDEAGTLVSLAEWMTVDDAPAEMESVGR